jgi:hypothetical protein
MLDVFVTQWDAFQSFVIGSKFLNAAITAPLLGAIPGALFGAWLGAYAATKMGSKSRRKKELEDELRDINRAISAAAGICNKIITLRQQHVIALKARYDALKQSYEGARLRGGRFEVGMDLQKLTPLTLSSAGLESLVLDKTTVGGRALAAAASLNSSCQDLGHIIGERNNLIEQLRSRRGVDEREGYEIWREYLGVADKDDNVDTSMGDFIAGIYSSSRDCAYFSKALTDELQKHGRRLHDRIKKYFGGEVPQVSEVSWGDAEVLLPSDEEYADWNKGFREMIPEPTWTERYGYKIGVLAKRILTRIGLVA